MLTAAPPTALVKRRAPLATITAATAAARRTATSASSTRTPPGTRRHGGLASSTAKVAASAKLLVACPLGKACPIASPTDGLSTYSVRPIAIGTATITSMTPRHWRVTEHARISASVMAATSFCPPRWGSQFSSTGNWPRYAVSRGSNAASSRSGSP